MRCCDHRRMSLRCPCSACRLHELFTGEACAVKSCVGEIRGLFNDQRKGLALFFRLLVRSFFHQSSHRLFLFLLFSVFAFAHKPSPAGPLILARPAILLLTPCAPFSPLRAWFFYDSVREEFSGEERKLLAASPVSLAGTVRPWPQATGRRSWRHCFPACHRPA